MGTDNDSFQYLLFVQGNAFTVSANKKRDVSTPKKKSGTTTT